MVISMLFHNLDPLIAKSVLFLQTAREIWLDLDERYGYVSGPQLYSLEQQSAEFTEGSQKITEFYSDIQALWDRIDATNPLPTCTCNNCTCNLTQKIFKLQQNQRLLQFLMKLHDHFSPVRANILMMNPLPNLPQAYRLLQ